MAIRDSGLDAIDDDHPAGACATSADGFTVRRALAVARTGAWWGRSSSSTRWVRSAFRSGEGLDVRPHPHIGLATVTYLIEGEIHAPRFGRLGAGDPAGGGQLDDRRVAGIVHSERTSPEVRAAGGSLFGLQTWIALPAAKEEIGAGVHASPGADASPRRAADGVTLTVIAGTSDGLRSPVAAYSDMVYVDIVMASGQPLPGRGRACRTCALHRRGQRRGRRPDRQLRHARTRRAEAGGRDRHYGRSPRRSVMLAGGEPFPEPRHICLEFRVEPCGPHRAGQGGLARPALCRRPRRA